MTSKNTFLPWEQESARIEHRKAADVCPSVPPLVKNLGRSSKHELNGWNAI
jgi:hypothetical protein